MTLAPGTKLGRYEIHADIGAGGMGHVYRAKDTSELNRTVAIKILPADLENDPKWMQRFVREARTVSALNHPNVVTIYEFGKAGSTRFMAMEYVEGVTLREHRSGKCLDLLEAVDIAIQVAAALTVAHEAHVVHRDIKPDNIMVRRRDGIVKILDFGLAKPFVKPGVEPGTGTNLMLLTQPGTVLGTVSYMSPEQSLGLKTLDYRTDIWSLGVVLYEMITGRLPFDGKDGYQQIVAIQEDPHLPLSTFVEQIPERLEQIINSALAKNPDDRYHTTQDFLNDLQNFKRQLALDAEHDRTALLDQRISGQRAVSSLPSREQSKSTSSAEYIFNQVKLHKRVALLMLFILAVSAVSLGYFLKRRSAALLTDKDTILLAEFENKTGEEVFDGTLRQGLVVQLQQSPFLDIFPDQRVRASLQLMSLSPDERVTRDRAREICQRQGLKAYISGTIVRFDRNYSITLEAVNGQTGDALALVQVEAEGRDQVLKSLSRAAKELREKLGESLSSLQKFDAKLEVTTSSLEALKEYAVARNEQDKGQSFKAIESYKRATEKDANFAVAWLGLGLQYANTGQPGLASECFAKAFTLADRVSEDERARVTYFYYQFVTGELDKAIEAQEAYVRNYPRESRGPGNLGNLYSGTGQFEKAVAATQQAQRLNPNTTIWPGNLAEALIGTNRFSEAKEVCERALAQKLDSTSIRERLYAVAFVNGDTQGQLDQLTWANGRPDEYRAVNWQTQTTSFNGQWLKSVELLGRSTELALRAEAKEVVAGYSADHAVRAAWLGQTTQAVTFAQAALKMDRNRNVISTAALALALAGETTSAEALIAELEQKFPKDTRVTQLWVPEIKAAIDIRKGSFQNAIDSLEITKRLEAAGVFWPQTLRATAYLGLGKGDEAAVEARKVLDHRGEAPLSLLWPIAHLNLARASAKQSNVAQAQKSYEDLFALWKDADKDLQILIQARREYEKLK